MENLLPGGFFPATARNDVNEKSPSWKRLRKKSEDPKEQVSCLCSEIDLCNKTKRKRTYFPTKNLSVVTLNLIKENPLSPKNGCVCVSNSRLPQLNSPWFSSG